MGEESDSGDASEPRDASESGPLDDPDEDVTDAPADEDVAGESGASDRSASPDEAGAVDGSEADDGAEADTDAVPPAPEERLDDESDAVTTSSETDPTGSDSAESESTDVAQNGELSGEDESVDDVASADTSNGSAAASTTDADDAVDADQADERSGPTADAAYDPTEFDFDDPEHYSHWIDDVDDEELERAEHYTQPAFEDDAADDDAADDDAAADDAAVSESPESTDATAASSTSVHEPATDATADGAADATADGAADATADGAADATAEGVADATAEGAAVSNSPTTATADGAVAEYSPGDSFADEGMLDGPDSDVEMPLADHIEEMVRRTAVVLVVAGVVTAFVFPIADDLVNFLWNTHIPGAATIEDRRPRLYGPLELILTELKVAGLAGFVIGLPVFVYETYRFMRPGLYPKERRYYLAAVPTSLVLALVGVAFAHFVVLPAIFAYFTAYTEGTAVIAFGLRETFGLILILMGYMALVFQIPLFIMLAIMMGLVTRQWLTEKRLLFWGGFLGVSFLVSPDPTGMAPIIIAATMISLFEGTLLLLRWTGR